MSKPTAGGVTTPPPPDGSVFAAQVAYMTAEIASILGLPPQSPAGTVGSVRDLMFMAENWKTDARNADAQFASHIRFLEQENAQLRSELAKRVKELEKALLQPANFRAIAIALRDEERAAEVECARIREELLGWINAWGNGDPNGWGDEVQGDDLRVMVDRICPPKKGGAPREGGEWQIQALLSWEFDPPKNVFDEVGSVTQGDISASVSRALSGRLRLLVCREHYATLQDGEASSRSPEASADSMEKPSSSGSEGDSG